MSFQENLQEAVIREIPESILEKNKVVISVVKGPKALIKVIALTPPKPKEPRMPKETVERMKVIKKSVKVNSDVTYLLTLLDDLKMAIASLDVKHLTPQASEFISTGLQEASGAMSKTMLLLEHKRS